MKVSSLFSGVGGFDLGFERSGMEVIAQVEQDKFAQSVLKKHWPEVELYEDVRNVGRKELGSAGLICGGFPCQDLSVAGKRAGLAGKRSGLWWEFARIIENVHPRWVIIENVPGLLSSNKGRDMGILTGKLAELGYWWSYRVLDSQYFGVAQRRKRVFIVGHSTEPTYPAKVLFEPESGERDNPPIREKGQGNTRVAPTLSSSGGGTERPGGQGAELDFYIPSVGTLTARAGRDGSASNGNINKLVPEYAIQVDNMNSSGRGIQEDIDYTLGGSVTGVMDTAWTVRGGKEGGGKGYLGSKSLAMTLGGQPQWVGVRRLTPLECERLQGFPDNFTEYGKDGEDISDTQRYKMMGNAVTVNVIEWIGKRIMEVENEH
jgi:DNA (cytosine-5)-methyltransferase 1